MTGLRKNEYHFVCQCGSSCSQYIDGMKPNPPVNPEVLTILCDAVVRLAELKQRECSHLCVENFSSECLKILIDAYNNAGTCDSCGEEAEAEVGQVPADWSSTGGWYSKAVDLCPFCNGAYLWHVPPIQPCVDFLNAFGSAVNPDKQKVEEDSLSILIIAVCVLVGGLLGFLLAVWLT